MEGLSQLLTDLYDISLQIEEPTSGELWTAEVYKVAGRLNLRFLQYPWDIGKKKSYYFFNRIH